MSTFKTALCMALAHPLYLLIYTVFISLMECSVLLIEVADGVTEVQLVYQLESATGEIEPAEEYVTDLFESLKAVAHGEALPTYE